MRKYAYKITVYTHITRAQNNKPIK